MSQENVDQVRRGYEAFARGDFAEVLDDIAEDIVFTDETLPEEPAQGRAGFVANVAMMTEAFDEFSYQVERLIDVGGDRVLALVRASGRGKGGGVQTQADLAQLWTLREGTAVRLDNYASWTKALEAVGLRE
jgi:ketosteroid isomerase-like protein